MTEQDKHFLRVMQEHLLHYGQIPKEDVAKLMAMARRPTRKALQDEIERLRAALRPLACTCKAKHQAECSRAEVDCPFWNARAALEGSDASCQL